ncbi:MAG: FimB/Mfa2 family fimbrial subunit [Culturomica sp.]|jgi:hypothetical protein|nr:FimB/Mfa2 family fimbrial subunit [Culturomica sp.]
MKQIFIAFFVLLAAACNREPAAWEEPKVEIPIVTRGAVEDGFTPANYRLFVYNKTTQQTSSHRISTGTGADGRFNLKLAPGTYSGYCFANANPDELWAYRATDRPSAVYLCLQSEGERYVEAGDYLSGRQDFTVEVSQTPAVVFDLERKVAGLRLIVEEVPKAVEGLRLHVAGVPGKMNLEGVYTSPLETVEKEIPLSGSGTSVQAQLLSFPSAEPVELSLFYRVGGVEYESDPYVLDSLPVNRITKLNVVFGSPAETSPVDFQVSVLEWDDELIREEDWWIDVDEELCMGSGDGVNLLANGGFEQGTQEGIPAGWKLDAGGMDRKVTLVTDPAKEGAYAVKLEGRTYLYQDVSVEGGGCYQLRLWVNAPSAGSRWRYWYTWMKGSTNLASEEIRDSKYFGETDGYVDIWNGRIVKAPAEATKLRVEIRTYIPADTSGELFVDHAGVERVTGSSK